MGGGVSTIHVKTLTDALDRPSTLKALARKTGYPVARVLQFIVEARASGVIIQAVSRGQYSATEPTYYVRIK